MGIALALAVASCGNDSSLPYTVAKNYFVRNDVTDVPSLITSQEQFDKYIGAAAFMGNDGEPTKIDFCKQSVIAVAPAETDKSVELAPVSFVKGDKNAVFTYSLKEGANMGYTIRPLLLVVFDKTLAEDVEVKKL